MCCFNFFNSIYFQLQELVDEDGSLVIEYDVTRTVTDSWVSVTTLLGTFNPVSVPVIKLTAQTGMVVCGEHTKFTPSAPAFPEAQIVDTASLYDPEEEINKGPLTSAEIDQASIQNIINTGSLSDSTSADVKPAIYQNIIQLEHSPYLHKRSEVVELLPSAPPVEDEQGKPASLPSTQTSVTSSVATVTNGETAKKNFETFEVHMARHR